jgi:hypothetical protein
VPAATRVAAAGAGAGVKRSSDNAMGYDFGF